MAMPLEWVEEIKKANAQVNNLGLPAAPQTQYVPYTGGKAPPIAPPPINSKPASPLYHKSNSNMAKKKDQPLIALDYFEMHEKLHGDKVSTLMQLCDAFPSTITFNENGPWIAGGAVRRWYCGIPQEGDIDIFFASEQQYKDFCKEMEQVTEIPVVTNKFNTTFRLRVDDFWSIDVQAIQHKFYSDVYNLLHNFDLTICQMAFDGDTIHTFQQTIDDNEKRLIRFHKISCGILSLMRIGKHMKQGYSVNMTDAKAFLEFMVKHPDRVEGPLISGTFNENNK